MSGGITKEFNAVKCKCDLTELKTKSVCVPWRVCGIVMHSAFASAFAYDSFVLCGVLSGACASASSRGLRSLAFCTCASACVELVLVTLCNQSSVVHLHTDTSCLLSGHSTFEQTVVSRLFPLPSLSSL